MREQFTDTSTATSYLDALSPLKHTNQFCLAGCWLFDVPWDLTIFFSRNLTCITIVHRQTLWMTANSCKLISLAKLAIKSRFSYCFIYICDGNTFQICFVSTFCFVQCILYSMIIYSILQLLENSNWRFMLKNVVCY